MRPILAPIRYALLVYVVNKRLGGITRLPVMLCDEPPDLEAIQAANPTLVRAEWRTAYLTYD